MVPGTPWNDVVLVLGLLVIGLGVIVLIVWQVFATWRVRMSVAREEAYRKLAEDVQAAQGRTAEAVAGVLKELTEIRQRTAEMERMLKEVG